MRACSSFLQVHLILRHKNPLNGTISEKHLKSPPAISMGGTTGLYTLKITPDGK